MITIKDIKEYGNGLYREVKVTEEGQTLTLEVNQETLIRVAKRYEDESTQYKETGLVYAYTEILNKNDEILWEVVEMLNPTLSYGRKNSPKDFQGKCTQLFNKVEESIFDFAGDMMDVGRPPQTNKGDGTNTRDVKNKNEEETIDSEDEMIFDKKVRFYGADISFTKSVVIDGQKLHLTFNQDTVQNVSEQFKHEGIDVNCSGIEYAYDQIDMGNIQILVETIYQLIPKLIGGKYTKIEDLMDFQKRIALTVMGGLDEYVEEVYRLSNK